MTEMKSGAEPQPKRGPSPMQPAIPPITSTRQFFSILFNKHRKPRKQ